MNRVVISIGSNSEDCQTQMELAIQCLKSAFSNVTASAAYETPALNGKDAPYLNAVAVGETEMTFEEATAFLKQWEKSCGRTPESKLKGVIPIDLDIVVWNNEIMREKDYSYSFFTQGYNQLIALGAISQD